jgi:hypothetical protein
LTGAPSSICRATARLASPWYAGASAARVAKVDERHLILILDFPTAEDADRVAREVGGPWMRENIRPLRAGDTERSVAEVIASAEA